MAKTKKNISEINGKARIKESEQGGKVSKGNFTELKNHSSYKNVKMITNRVKLMDKQ